MFQSEAKWEIIDMKWFFYFLANKTHFQNQGFALSLVLKVRVFGLMITGAQGFALSLVLKVRVFGLMITGAHE